ncbi:helix-turn-helix domain-containing protein [Moritella viscosa]|uniref:helix-turn-helix domain-containing protein n=1 Tax=Moritella viscosa TaxID=80854 RepID=UPI00091FCB51|nr:helix-turn-helix domain-containing protein [Moritella viscosa]SHO14524.1 Putative uncharacterized protein [Moritella viscosa]SHO15466.1 Putative uncharacterized protein [Moritella viscosa]SHO19224.1 Putative uncharacterized protein [Moritella viscosa]
MAIKYRFLNKDLGTAETRFFILKLCELFNSGEDILWQTKELSKQCGVTNNVVTRSLQQLYESEYLEKSNINENKKGRPKCHYLFTNKLKKLATEIQNTEVSTYVKSIIDTILIVGREDQHYELRVSNRLLLCVLVVNSYGYGAVNNLSTTDISKLTGMSKDRVRSQIKKLIELGYISRYTAGISQSNIFGKKNSTYVLALWERFSLLIGNKTESFRLNHFMCIKISHVKNNQMQMPYDKNSKLSENEATFKRCYVAHHKRYGKYDSELLGSIDKIFRKNCFNYLTVYHLQLKMEEVLCDYLASSQDSPLEFMKLNEEGIATSVFEKTSGSSVFSPDEKKYLLNFICQFICSFNHYVKPRWEHELADNEKANYQIIHGEDEIVLVRYVDN